MNTIEAYIFRRVFTASFSAFAAMLAVVWITQAVTRIDFATGTAQSAFVFLTIMAYLTPQLISITLPFGILVGVVNVFNALNTDSELPVVASAGVSRALILRPVMLVASFASLFVLVSNHFIEPSSNRAVRDTVVEARSDLLTSFIKEGRFERPENGLVIYVDQKNSNGQLVGLMISDTREEGAQLNYFAQTAIVTDVNGVEALAMTDGQIHRRETATGNVSIISFDTYALSLAQFGSAAGEATYFLHEQDTSYLWDVPDDDRLAQRWPGQARAELTKRFTEWMMPILFALVALAIIGQPQSHRTSGGIAMFIAFGGGMLYRWATYFAYNETKDSPDLAIVLAGIPIFGILLGLFMFLRGIEFKAHETLGHYFVQFVGQLRARFGAKARSAP
ncbi:MAG: LptF/LptG family permease [Pseudomonadota bacterium]